MGRDAKWTYFYDTRHLILRKMDPADADRLFENHAEQNVKKWFPNESYADINEAKEAIWFFRDCVDQNHLPFVLAIQLKGLYNKSWGNTQKKKDK